MSKKRRPTTNVFENRMVRNLDELAEFEDYVGSVLPRIRKMLKQGKKGKDIYEAFKDELVARKMTIALDPNVAPEKALAAINSLDDRIEGRPVERKQVAHAFAEMGDIQLDALLVSELDAEDVLTVEDAENKEEESDK